MRKELSETYQQIYTIVQQIPSGKVCTYGIIAQLIGTHFSARVVGYALRHAHGYPEIPAHRVVNRNGLLTGRLHFHPPELMQILLEKEGICIQNNHIQDFKECLWNPLEDANYL